MTAPVITTPQSEPGARAARLLDPEHRALVLGVVGVVVAVAFEAIAVATAMPVAAKELGGLRSYGLAFSAFLTTSLLGMVAAGVAADRRGPVRPFLAASAVFAAGLLLAGVAPNMTVLVLARAVQGLGAGLNIVALYVVVARAFPADLRPRVFSAIASGWVLPSLLGPPVAGFLADQVSWRWVFLGVLPLLLGATLLVRPHLAGLDTPAEQPAGGAPGRTGGRQRLRLAVLAALGAGLVQYAGQATGRAGVALALAAAGAVLLVVGVPRLLPADTFRLRRGLPTAVALRGLLAGGFFGAEAFLPLMLVEHRGLATTWAGASLTGAALTWTAGSWLQGRPGLRVPRTRLVTVGVALVLVGVALAALATAEPVPVWTAAIGWAVAGLGMGLGLTSLSVIVLELSPEHEQGANSSALQVSDALGSILLMSAGGALAAAGDLATARPYLLIDLVMGLTLLVATVAGPRVRDTR